MTCSLVLSWREGVTASVVGDITLVVQGPTSKVSFRNVSAVLRDVFCNLAYPGQEEKQIEERLVRGEPGPLSQWYYYCHRLATRGFLCYGVQWEGKRLATLVAISSSFFPMDWKGDTDQAYRLSRFAYVRRDGDLLVLESPLAHARVILDDSAMTAVVGILAIPVNRNDLENRVGRLPVDAVWLMINLFMRAGMLELSNIARHGEPGAQDVALKTWSFHDLLFHARSRGGRSDAPFGATYRFLDKLPPPEAIKSLPAGKAFDLFRPDLELLQRTDPPFAKVQEERRSIRSFDTLRPMTEAQLGEFLYRVARVKECWESEVDTPKGPIRMGFSRRPYPSGGSLYELELYVVVNLCPLLEAGLYYYDPVDHRLIQFPDGKAKVVSLLYDAALSTGVEQDNIQVLIIVAARFPRVAWKYESIAYALILKHVGVLFQTMYLAATAMGLGPCAIGGGNSERFAEAVGTDYYSETSVGEFLLGSYRPDSVSPVLAS